MPLTRQQKEAQVQAYEEELAAAPHVFLMDYKGITVPQVTELRDKVRETGGSYEVIRNRLALRVTEGKPIDDLREHFQGPTAAAFTKEDPVTLAKVLTDFAKGVPAIEFKAGLVEGRPVAGDEVLQIATLPSRPELIAKLLFLMQSPISGLARVLGAIPRQFVVVLDQIRQEKEKAS